MICRRLTSINLVVRRVRSYKYRQIALLIALYERFGLVFCEAADVLADGQFVSTVVPPVFEEWGTTLVAIEGNTRLLYLHHRGAKSVTALVARGVGAPLPGTAVTPHEALLSTYDLDLNVGIKNFCHDNFRAIEGATRPEE